MKSQVILETDDENQVILVLPSLGHANKVSYIVALVNLANNCEEFSLPQAFQLTRIVAPTNVVGFEWVCSWYVVCEELEKWFASRGSWNLKKG